MSESLRERILAAVQRYWGYDTLRPLQEEAIAAGLERRDSVVVMPTGGGKSLCYQVPPLLADALDVVVSPLIALMKDQVDGLQAAGYPAIALHSGMSAPEWSNAYAALDSGEVRLLLVSPERLVRGDFLARLRELRVRSFAIDEAHCISHWGHDFRPEYRGLSLLKERFPDAGVHAYTATATPRVREDIARQLNLDDPKVLVGVFDRPNLAYRIEPRVDESAQVVATVERHRDEAVIVYCLSKKDTERLAKKIESRGIKARPYHAGLAPGVRRKTQDAFARGQVNVVTATVAFGMGIDRGDVRCVVHAGMPQSVEHYQQETGRAGRDGLEAECVLLYSYADVMKWTSLFERSGDEESNAGKIALLKQMQGLCGTLECRHRALSRYFGQDYERENCGACDVCLGERPVLADSTATAQKILSCVYRVGERFGIGHIVSVLRGTETDMVQRCRHQELSTWGLLSPIPVKVLTNLVYQLVDQGLLERTEGDRPVIQLAEAARPVLRGERDVQLLDPGRRVVKASRADAESWEGVDRDLFERLRERRTAIAAERGVPAYIVFGDRSLRDMARKRPTTLNEMAHVHGVGERKLGEYGAAFIEIIRDGDGDGDALEEPRVVLDDPVRAD